MAPGTQKRIKGKTSRKLNWDSHETLSLLDAYESEVDNYINCDRQSRRDLWRKITDQIYSDDAPFQRTNIEVQKKWRNLCTAARHEIKKNELKRKSGIKLKPLPHILARVYKLLVEEDKIKGNDMGRTRNKMVANRRASNSKVAASEIGSPVSSNTSETLSEPLSPSPTRESMALKAEPLSLLTTTPVLPSASVGASNSILPNLVSTCLTPCTKDQRGVLPIIKKEPRTPSPPPSTESRKSTNISNGAKTVSVSNSMSQVLTFQTPSSTNTSTTASPFRIISIVNPLSTTSASSSTNSVTSPPRIIFKPMPGIPALSKSSSSNMLILGSPKTSNSAGTQPPILPLRHVSPSLPPVLFPQAPHVFKKPEEVKITGIGVPKLELEKLNIEQERIKLEKERLQIEREKLNLEKEKFQHEKVVYQNERNSKRTLLDEEKIILENGIKKLKLEIDKLNLEKEVLALQMKRTENQ